MKRLLVAASAVMILNGCTAGAFMYQVGVVVEVTNNCTARLEVKRVGEINPVALLLKSESRSISLRSRAFSGNSRSMVLVARGWNSRGEYVGSASRQFSVDVYTGTYETDWPINQLFLPNGRGGCE